MAVSEAKSLAMAASKVKRRPDSLDASFLIDFHSANSILKEGIVKDFEGSKALEKLSLNTGLVRFFCSLPFLSLYLSLPLISFETTVLLESTTYPLACIVQIGHMGLFTFRETQKDSGRNRN